MWDCGLVVWNWHDLCSHIFTHKKFKNSTEVYSRKTDNGPSFGQGQPSARHIPGIK